MKAVTTLLFLTSSMVALSGCSSLRADRYAEPTKGAAIAADTLMNKGRKGELVDQAPRPSPVIKDSGIYIPVRKAAQENPGKNLSRPELRRQVTLNGTFFSVQDIAERITALTGIPFSVASDVNFVEQQAGQMQQMPPMQAAGQQGGMGGLPNLPVPGGVMGFGVASGNPADMTMSLTYSGSLAGLLDVVSSRYGIEWELAERQIRLFRFVSKTFRVIALPGDTKMDAVIGTSNSGNSSSSNSGGNVTNNSNVSQSSTQTSSIAFSGLSVWKGLEDSVKTMLTKSGKVMTSPALGTITVTDTPTVIAQVEKFIDQQNASLSRQVVVNFRVLSVELTDSDAYGINWDAVYKSLTSVGVTLKSSISSITGAGNLAFSVMRDGSRWQGSQAMIEALSTQGRVTTLRSSSMTTLNNQPAPLQVGRSTAYVASSETSISTGVSSTSMSTGTVNTGFSMTLLPHIMNDSSLLLQYAIDISSLLSMGTVTSGTSILQLPDVDRRGSLQRVMASSGDTIVIAGFEDDTSNSQKGGMLDADNPMLGGSIKGNKNRSIIVILLQPIIAEPSNLSLRLGGNDIR